MAIDTRLAHPCEARKTPRNDVREAVEAPAGELALPRRRLQVETDRANLRPLAQKIERRPERIVDEQHVCVENEQSRRRTRRRSDIDAGGEAAVAARSDQADVIAPSGGQGRIRRLTVIDDDDVSRLRDAMIADRAEQPQTGLCGTVIDDDDVEIFGRGHGVTPGATCANPTFGAGIACSVRRVSNSSRADRLP
ncbi:hypothetical protein OCK01_04015 [Rhizobium sp. TRM95796]|nr:hypothetical protein [Rhizobium sp. TRM95796]MCV3764744.1 hypothetical protein [Rhizobium sp. TRM95796]